MDLPFKISASASSLVLHVEEDTNDSYVEFGAFNPKDKTFGLVRFTFDRFLCGRLYSLGGEAGSDIGIVADSRWLKEYKSIQEKTFPNTNNDLNNVRHYYFHGHDVSVEVLAEAYHWEIIGEFER